MQNQKNIEGVTAPLDKWKFFIVLFVIWTLLGLSFAGISYLAASSENREVSAWSIFFTNVLRFYIWALLSPLIYSIAKRINFTSRESALVKNILIYLPLGLVFSFIHTLIYTYILWYAEDSFRARYPSIVKFFQESAFYGSIYLGILLYALIAITIQAWLLLQSYRLEESRSMILQAQLAESELQALKMQIQPHFLFNTLHSIASLNLIDPHKANLMIARLGEFLRMTLDRSGEQMVSFGEEIAFLRCYLEIEQIRFSDRLTIEFDTPDETLAAEVPHLILQPLVENSIKHAIAPHAKNGVIHISSERRGEMLVLKIADNGIGIEKKTEENNGTGIRNIRARLAQIYGENFSFELANRNGTTASLEIPFKTH